APQRQRFHGHGHETRIVVGEAEHSGRPVARSTVVPDLELLEKHDFAPSSSQAPRRGGAHRSRSHHDRVDPVHRPQTTWCSGTTRPDAKRSSPRDETSTVVAAPPKIISARSLPTMGACWNP